MSNGTNMRATLAILGAILAIGLSIFASARDTPTRGEMEAKDELLEARVTAQLDRIEQATQENRRIIIQILREVKKP